MMSSGNYPGNMNYEEQGYICNGQVPTFPDLNQSFPGPSGQNTGEPFIESILGGAHIEEVLPSSLSNVKQSITYTGKPGRRRKKSKKKSGNLQVANDLMNIERVQELDGTLTSNTTSQLPNIQAMPPDLTFPIVSSCDTVYGVLPPVTQPEPEVHPIFNSDTMNQILSYKKMLLMESPDVKEYIEQLQKTNR